MVLATFMQKKLLNHEKNRSHFSLVYSHIDWL